MNANHSEAYDFERFSPQKEKPDNVVKLPVNKQPQPHAKRSVGRMVRPVAVCAVCFMMFGSLIYNQMTINELNTNIQKVSAQLNRAQNEYIQLQMAAESKVTLDEVEKYAVDVLGMQKLQDDQVTYIRMNDQDKIEVTAGQDSSLWSKITTWFSGIFS